MISGKPIVASYVGYPSMINEASCGSYVAVGDVKALESEIRRYDDMSERERFEIGQRGPAWLKEKRQYTKLAKDYLQIMLDVGTRA
jgi:glycosyltransferase involved in cell wall biosynthesis